MLFALQRSLVKPLEPSSRAASLRRAERLDAGRLQIVDDAGAQRRLRPDHDEIDLVRLAERDHRRVVGDVERHAFRLLRDAGVARRADQPVGERARRHLPGQRVLAPAGAEEKDVHAGNSLARPRSAGHAAVHRVHRPGSTATRPRGLLVAMTAPLRALGRCIAAVCRPLRRGAGRPVRHHPVPLLQAGKPARSWCSRRRPRTAASTSAPTRPRSAPPRSGSPTSAGRIAPAQTSWQL